MYLNTAPPGWKVLATGADTVLGVAGGSQAYNVNGGNPGGTWTQPNHTHTGPSHTHTTGNLALTEAQMPSHIHLMAQYWSQGSRGQAEANSPSHVLSSDGWSGDFAYHLCYGTAEPNILRSGYTGSGSVHNHGSTGSSGTGATGGGATESTYRPSASVGKLFQFDTA